jgi:gamma-glutamyltranspeptidase/glutathione hydrolase
MRDGGYVMLESGVPAEAERALTQRGHTLRAGPRDGGFGGYQAIRWDPVNKVYWGASESRKDGCAMGY